MITVGGGTGNDALRTSDFPDLITKRVCRVGFFASDNDSTRQQTFTTTVGETPRAVLRPYDYTQALDVTRITAINNAGQLPLIAWMPANNPAVTVQPTYSLANIIAGNFDSWMTTFLTAVKNLGFPVAIRWAHEMNGNWYPWSEQANGNSAGQYVTAWRHVVDLARSLGATNISWVWSPNTPYPGATAYTSLYPGDAYVDVVATQGYNWGTSGPDGLRTPAQVFDPAIAQLKALAPTKPIWITECGCVDDTNLSKAAWLGQFFTWLAANPIGLFMWYDDIDSGYDWRVTSPSAAGPAFKAGLAGLRTTTKASGPDVRPQLAGSADVAALNKRLDAAPGSLSSMWSAGGMETLSRIGNVQITGVSGRLRLSYFTAPVANTINTFALPLGDTAHVTPTLTRIGLFTVAASGDLTLVARTANATALGGTAYGATEAALSTTGGYPASYTFVAGQRYAVGVLDVAATPANLRGGSVDVGGYAPTINRHIDSQTDIAATYTNGSLTSYYQPVLVVGLYY